MVKIKFCGLTRMEDYLTAWKLGVDYAGFVCYSKSVRYITPHAVHQLFLEVEQYLHAHKEHRALYSHIPRPKTVGLFVDATEEQLEAAIACANFDIVQLYHWSSVSKVTIPVWIVQRVAEKKDIFAINAMEDELQSSMLDIQAIVIDKYSDVQLGGTGDTFDWSILEHLRLTMHYFIAGGIRIDNVNTLLSFQPYGIDLSSGIERVRGVKDYHAMEDIMIKIRNYYASTLNAE